MARRKRIRNKTKNKASHGLKAVMRKEKKIEHNKKSAIPAAVGGMVRSRVAKVSMGVRHNTNTGASGGERIRLKGREFISYATISATQHIGDSIFQSVVSPQSLTGTRLQVFAQLYERWRPIRWKITYIPNIGTGATGSLVMYYEPDPTDPLPSGQLAIQRAMSATGVDFPIYTQNRPSVTAKVEKEFTNLFTNDGVETRLSQAGYIACFCGFESSSLLTVGQFVLDYDIEFFKPLLELSSQALSLSQSAYSVTTPTAIGVFGSLIVANPNNSINVTRTASTIIRFTPAGTNVVYGLLLRLTSASATSNISLSLTSDGFKTVTANVSTFAIEATKAIYWVNFSAPDTFPINIAQTTSAGVAPITVNFMLTRMNSLLSSVRTPIDVRMSKVEDLLKQFFLKEEGQDSGGSVEETPDLEGLIKKYLTQK